MPSGRDIHSPKVYIPPNLDEDTLARMRAPPENIIIGSAMENDSSNDSGEEEKRQSNVPGAFPGSSVAKANDNTYY